MQKVKRFKLQTLCILKKYTHQDEQKCPLFLRSTVFEESELKFRFMYRVYLKCMNKFRELILRIKTKKKIN